MEALETAKERSDEYVTILEKQLDEYRRDNAELRDRDVSRESMDSLYDRIMDARKNPPLPERREPSVDIEKIIEAKLQAQQQAMLGKQNVDSVKDKLREAYGDSYRETLKKHLEVLDLTEDEGDTLAATKPRTFLRMLGLDRQTENFQSPVSNSNLSSTNVAEPKRDWTYYQNLKKTDPRTYYNPKTNLQMLEDYRKLGNEFETGDFRRFGDSIENR